MPTPHEIADGLTDLDVLALTLHLFFTVVATLVVRLRLPISPSAVVRAVGSGWVDPVKAKAFGAWAHVSQECSEVASPLVAHEHSPSAVVSVRLVRGGVASPLGVAPRFVFLGASSVLKLSSYVSVPRRASRHQLWNSAAATLRTAVFQRADLSCSHGSTFAPKAIETATTFTDNGPESKPFPDHVLSGWPRLLHSLSAKTSARLRSATKRGARNQRGLTATAAASGIPVFPDQHVFDGAQSTEDLTDNWAANHLDILSLTGGVGYAYAS